MKKRFIISVMLFLFVALGGLAGEVMNGKVLEVKDDYGFVIISIGKKDGVEKRMLFLVYRENKLLGKIEVEEVFDDMSSCVILPWYRDEEIKVDDGVLKP